MKKFKDMFRSAEKIAQKHGGYIITEPTSDVDLKEKAKEMEKEDSPKKKKKKPEKVKDESMQDAAKRIASKHGYVDIEIKIKTGE